MHVRVCGDACVHSLPYPYPAGMHACDSVRRVHVTATLLQSAVHAVRAMHAEHTTNATSAGMMGIYVARPKGLNSNSMEGKWTAPGSSWAAGWC